MYILGDLNCDVMKADKDSNTPTKKIKSLYELYQLSQLIDKSTRVTMTTSSLIDHIVTNTPEKISDSGVVHTGISDHSLAFAIRKISVVKTDKHSIEIRNMKNFNENKFISELMQQHWKIYTIVLKIQMPCGKFGKVYFLEVLDKHAPSLQHKKLRSKKFHGLQAVSRNE